MNLFLVFVMMIFHPSEGFSKPEEALLTKKFVISAAIGATIVGNLFVRRNEK